MMDDTEQVACGVARTPWDALRVLSVYHAREDVTRWIVSGLRLDNAHERSYATRAWKTERAAQRSCDALIARRRARLALYDNYKWDRYAG